MIDDPGAFGGSGEDALLDQMLRDQLTHLPDADANPALSADASAAIDRAITEGWPDGTPPTAERIARDDAGDSALHAHESHDDQSWHTDTPGHHDLYGHHIHDSHQTHADHDPFSHLTDGHHLDGGHH
jgi:hypothetical protein